MSRERREIGLACWPTGNRRACDAQFNVTPNRGEKNKTAYDRLHQEAGKAGWCIGHWDGQAYYVCPEHKDSVFDPVRL